MPVGWPVSSRRRELRELTPDAMQRGRASLHGGRAQHGQVSTRRATDATLTQAGGPAVRITRIRHHESLRERARSVFRPRPPGVCPSAVAVAHRDCDAQQTLLLLCPCTWCKGVGGGASVEPTRTRG